MGLAGKAGAAATHAAQKIAAEVGAGIACKASKIGAAVPTAGALALAMPAVALADGKEGAATSSGNTAIQDIFDALSNSVLYPVYYGLLTIIAILALIFLIKEIVGIATAPDGAPTKNGHITQCVVILVACLVLGFAPGVINSLISLGNGANIAKVK